MTSRSAALLLMVLASSSVAALDEVLLCDPSRAGVPDACDEAAGRDRRLRATRERIAGRVPRLGPGERARLDAARVKWANKAAAACEGMPFGSALGWDP